MNERDWSAFACPNPTCAAYGQRGGSNLYPHGWSSKTRPIRCLRCSLCGKNFSERSGTPLFRTHLPTEKILQLAHPVVEGKGMRPTSRLCGVGLNTVLRVAHRAGNHAQLFHDQLVRHREVEPVQADEAWSFVGKKS
jgi:transposase-like protein